MIRHPIVGVWRLQAFSVEDVETGARSEPFGAAPQGVMMFHPEGRVVALLTPRDRQPPTTADQQAAAFQTLVAASGPYRIEPPDRFVIAVDVAWFAPWVGSEQVRIFKIDGDAMEIVSLPTRLPRPEAPDATVIATLSWRREAPWRHAG